MMHGPIHIRSYFNLFSHKMLCTHTLIPVCVCIASCDSGDKIGLKMTDQYSKLVAYVITLGNEVVVLTYGT